MDPITLEYPISVGEEKIAAVALRRPTVDDLEKADEAKTGMKKARVLIGLIMTFPDNPNIPVTPSIVGRIDAADFDTLSGKIESFLPKGRRTGGIV